MDNVKDDSVPGSLYPDRVGFNFRWEPFDFDLVLPFLEVMKKGPELLTGCSGVIVYGAHLEVNLQNTMNFSPVNLIYAYRSYWKLRSVNAE